MRRKKMASTYGRRVPLVLVLASLLALTTSAQAVGESSRTVTGQIAFSSPYELVSWCAWAHGGEASQGVVGYVIPLLSEESQGDYSFRLRATAPTASVLPVALNYRLLPEIRSCMSYPVYFPWGSGDRVADVSGNIPAGARYVFVTIPKPATADPGLCYYYWVPFVFPCRLPSAQTYGTAPVNGGFELQIFPKSSS